MKSEKNIQLKFRRKVFDVHQYWNINYTERYSNGSEKDFKTFIKAKSYESAKRTLKERLLEDDPEIKVKAIIGFMFHSNYKSSSNIKLRTKEWEEIRSASFPNVNNCLYKYEVERGEGKSNRFNKTDYDHVRSIGFKSGKKNWSHINRKGVVKPLKDREGMIYSGKWVKWDKVLMDQTRKQIIHALVKCNGNRSRAALFLGVSRHKFYSLMAKFPKINWNEEYPKEKRTPPIVSPEVRVSAGKKSIKTRMENGFVPFSNLTEEDINRRTEALKETNRKKRAKRLKEFIPQAKNALMKNNNARSLAASHLGLSSGHFSKLLKQTSDQVDWGKEFPLK
jgi:hypothetical protein